MDESQDESVVAQIGLWVSKPIDVPLRRHGFEETKY